MCVLGFSFWVFQGEKLNACHFKDLVISFLTLFTRTVEFLTRLLAKTLMVYLVQRCPM